MVLAANFVKLNAVEGFCSRFGGREQREGCRNFEDTSNWGEGGGLRRLAVLKLRRLCTRSKKRKMVSGCLIFRRSPNEGIARKRSVTLDDLGFFTLVKLRLSFLAFDGVSFERASAGWSYASYLSYPQCPIQVKPHRDPRYPIYLG